MRSSDSGKQDSKHSMSAVQKSVFGMGPKGKELKR